MDFSILKIFLETGRRVIRSQEGVQRRWQVGGVMVNKDKIEEAYSRIHVEEAKKKWGDTLSCKPLENLVFSNTENDERWN